jgi:flagellar motility protein MotE (MotC chaperone)
MIGFFRELRLVPIALVASACLLALIAADLLLGQGASRGTDSAPVNVADTTIIHAAPGALRPGDAQRSWAQQMFNFPDANGGAPATPPTPARLASLPELPPLAADKNNADIITGSVSGNNDDKSEGKPKGEAAATGKDAKPAAAAGAGKDGPPLAAPPNGTVIPNGGAPAPSAAERAILERLSERRQELEKRARELDIREGLIGDAEKRVEAKLAEIKEAEAQLVTDTGKKNEADAARFKGLVTMYENMKPRDAAKIFDRLEVGVLLDVASQINPRRMADILAQMSPDSAERLTVELASRAQGGPKGGNAELPKIEGRPTAQ